MADTSKHTIAVLVENKFGVLSRVAGLFSARGYNIESLSVGETLDPVGLAHDPGGARGRRSSSSRSSSSCTS